MRSYLPRSMFYLDAFNYSLI